MSQLDVLGPMVVDICGLELQAEEAEFLQHPQVGGLILFARNYADPQQLQSLLQSVRAVRPGLLITVDQEGGRVQRFREGFTRLPPLQRLGDCYAKDPHLGLAAARQCGWLMAAELLSAGVDMSFAPVLDMDRNHSQVIGDRALSDQVEVVAALGEAYLKGMSEAGMAGCAKHFPGHGAIVADSHISAPVDERSLQEVRATDMQPFVRLAPHFQAVMPAHIQFINIDPLPAGYSPFWLQQVLRTELAFTGVIFSDDLSMEGAAVLGGYRDRAQAALQAGCDAVLVCNAPQQARDVARWLEEQSWPRSDRLSVLQPLRQPDCVSLGALRQTPRWQAAQSMLTQLSELK